jgi:sulfopropanediol 3-dehydrogenase
MRYLKKAPRSAGGEATEITAAVAKILRDVESGGEQAARDYAVRFDHWEGDIIVAATDRECAVATLSQHLKDDIAFAHDNVRRFADAQRAAILDTEIELLPGLVAGHRNIPVATAGCYVPGGRYTHLASAIMSVTTAKTAGVQHVIAACPPRPGVGINPAVLYALDLCGADTILNLGGVQAIAALAFGLFTGQRADILVGPGNQYVAEAKRLLYGRVGIDMFAGPSEIMIIADATADPQIVAADLVGQAEHGYNSPARLIALSSELAAEVMSLVPGLIASLPEVNAKNAEAAWREFGEIVVVDSREAAVRAADVQCPRAS